MMKMKKTEMMKTEKSELMIEYEIMVDSIVNWEEPPKGYTKYLESKIFKMRSIVKDYDRIMSGEKKTLKELANILGKPVAIDAENRLWWFPKKPEIGWTTWIWYDNQFGSFGEELPNGLIAYTGDWQDSLTLPDGLEEK
jgi:hypothetical protein